MGDRSDLLFNLDTVQAFASKLQKEALSGQTDLFGGMAEMSEIQPTVALTPAPVKHTDKERLTWERELLGLYVSAHPLDNYAAYFEEQTMAMSELTQGMDGKTVTIGGLISTVRTIITTSGTKMAFVGLEDKVSEGELIVFPNLFEQVGGILEQDAVIKATGKVSARDREGNLTGEVKVIADEIKLVSDDELRNYKASGKKMQKPKGITMAGRPGGGFRKPGGGGGNKQPSASARAESATIATVVDTELKTLFVRVADPNDQQSLKDLKTLCGNHPGLSDIVLVLGSDEKKSAIKLPFRVDTSDDLVSKLVKLLGEDAVKLK